MERHDNIEEGGHPELVVGEHQDKEPRNRGRRLENPGKVRIDDPDNRPEDGQEHQSQQN